MLTGDQIYIAQLSNLQLTVTSGNAGAPQSPPAGTVLTFDKDESFQTSGNNQNGYYVLLGLPGQAQLYLAGGTRIVLELPLQRRDEP